MTQAIARQRLSFEEYVDFCAQTDERYELVQGELSLVNPPTVLHYRIAKFLERVLDQAISEQFPNGEWETFREAGQRTENSSSRLPDLEIVSKEEADCLLNQTAVFQSPSLLCVEIVSPSSATEDYGKKLQEYQSAGIPEYWIIDPEALGSSKYLGFPKRPTITICTLSDSGYQKRFFRDGDRIESPTFPSLNLTAEQVFKAER